MRMTWLLCAGLLLAISGARVDAAGAKALNNTVPRNLAQEEDDDDEGDDPEGVVGPYNSAFSQPEIKKLPANDKDAEAEVRKAYEKVYSAQRSGMKKCAADVSAKYAINTGAGDLSSTGNLKLVYKGEAALVVGGENEAPQNEVALALLMAALGGARENLSEKDFLFRGLNSFEDHFKGLVFAGEESKEKDVKLVRAWKNDFGDLSSFVLTITNGLVTRLDLPHEAWVITTVEEKGKTFTKSIVTTSEYRTGTTVIKDETTYEVETRSAAGDFMVGTKVTVKGKDLRIDSSYTLTIELSNIATNGKVTKAMVVAAGGEADDADDKPDPEKPAPEKPATEKPVAEKPATPKEKPKKPKKKR